MKMVWNFTDSWAVANKTIRDISSWLENSQGSKVLDFLEDWRRKLVVITTKDICACPSAIRCIYSLCAYSLMSHTLWLNMIKCYRCWNWYGWSIHVLPDFKLFLVPCWSQGIACLQVKFLSCKLLTFPSTTAACAFNLENCTFPFMVAWWQKAIWLSGVVCD